MSALQGNGEIRFGELFVDTVNCHGIQWAHNFYCVKHGMQQWEFRFWSLYWLRNQ